MIEPQFREPVGLRLSSVTCFDTRLQDEAKKCRVVRDLIPVGENPGCSR